MVTIKVANLNINELVSRTKLAMLVEFFRRQEIDTLLLQEVTSPSTHPRGYRSYFNVGTAGRGTVLITRDEFTITYINPLKPELNPICCLLALLGAHHFLHVSRIRVKLLTLR